MRFLAISLAATLLLASIPMAAGHAAPAPAEYETRLLHDHNDDSLVVLAGKHGFDTIALDGRTAWSAQFGEPQLILKLILNGGCRDAGQTPCDELSQVVQFSANGANHELTFSTTDEGASWSGDMDWYSAPIDLNDGTRFATEAGIRFSALDLNVGDELSDFFVKGYADGEDADHMPEGVAGHQGADPLGAAFDIGTFTLVAPDGYIDASTDLEAIDVSSGDVSLNISLENLLSTAQTVTFLVDAGGLEVEVPDAVDLLERDTSEASITVRSGASEATTLTIDAISSLGGIARIELPLTAGLEASPVLDSPAIEAGGEFSHVFLLEGGFEYHNHMGPGHGKLVIGPTNSTVSEHVIRYDGQGFDPEELHIHVGDTVTWINDSDGQMRIMGAIGHSHDHGDHHDEPLSDDKESPGVGLAALIACLAGLAIVRRR